MKPALQELSSISTILSAAHHRNKNQHRITKWWKAFCVLRRNVDKLVVELQKWESESKLVGETKWTEESREAVELRAEFMLERVVPKCYVAFSGVVADLQFASLGLMLMGTLARVRTVILPMKREDVKDVVENDSGDATGGVALPTDGELDFGEVVRRDEVAKPSAGSKVVGRTIIENNEAKPHAKKKRTISTEKAKKTQQPEKTSEQSTKKRRKTDKVL